ncbi:MAG: S49 family peptidase [Planctomycetota bacterium]
MLRIFTVTAALFLTIGCAHRPLRVVMTGDVDTRMPPDNTASRLHPRVVSGSPDSEARIAVIDVDGLLVDQNMRGYESLGENPVALFREKLKEAERDPGIRAVVIRINSPGGGVTASDIMRRDLMTFQSRRDIPVIACLMDVGTGGAYYLATAADSIMAHPTSIVGGVGVIMNLYNLQDSLGQFNVLPLPIKAGKKIDMASSIRPMDPDERAILDGIAGQFHERFKREVTRTRPHHAATEEDFDGRVFSARKAHEKQLIDGIGYLDDAIVLAGQSAGLGESPGVVMYRRCNDRALTAYDVTPNVPLQNSLFPFNIPGLDRSSLPRFLYLWQPDPSFVTQKGSS